MPESLTSLLSYAEQHPDWAYWVGGISLATFFLSLILIPWIIIKLPEDYFSDRARHASVLKHCHPARYFVIITLKNLVALFLVIAGLLMLVLPGQGLLTLLIGLSLSDFPGKFRVERWLMSRPSVFGGVNWIRSRAHKPPLQPIETKGP